MTRPKYIRGHFLDNAILAIGRAALRLEARLGRTLDEGSIRNLALQVQYKYGLIDTGNPARHLQFTEEVLRGIEFLRVRQTEQIRHDSYHDFQSDDSRGQSPFFEGAAILNQLDEGLSDDLQVIIDEAEAEDLGR